MDQLQSFPFVKNVKAYYNDSKLTIHVDDVKTNTPEIVKNIVYAGGLTLSVETLRPSFEEAYLKIIGREMKI